MRPAKGEPFVSLRLIFTGTPDFAVPTPAEPVAYGHEVGGGVHPRAEACGRGMKEQVTPVEREARRLGIPVPTPKTLKTPDAQAEFAAHQADAAVVVAYGLILPQAILEAVAARLLQPACAHCCRAGAGGADQSRDHGRRR